MKKRRMLRKSAVLGVMLALALLVCGQVVNAAPPVVGGCSVFPANNLWNLDVSGLPTLAKSANYIASINANHTTLHADFDTDPNDGIPYTVVNNSQPLVPINFTESPEESDDGPYPIPPTAPIEGGGAGDSHVLVINSDTCKLYELYAASYNNDAAHSWDAGSGAIFDFNSNGLRPLGWTSADAAGLPIFPGLVRYDEVQTGTITHALRFTVNTSQAAYILPASHFASKLTNPNQPPMGLRLRLKASFDISSYPPASKIILQALKTYGMIVADNGSSWYISGTSDSRWDYDNDLSKLGHVPGSMFEAVYTGPLITRLSGPPNPPTSAAPSPHYFTVAKPTLTWNLLTWAVRYELEISENASFIGAVRYDAQKALTFTIPVTLPNGPYYWHVRGCTTPVSCAPTWSPADTFVVNAP